VPSRQTSKTSDIIVFTFTYITRLFIICEPRNGRGVDNNFLPYFIDLTMIL